MGINQVTSLKARSLNWRNVLNLFTIGQFSIVGAVFFMLDAENLKGYIESFYIFETAFLYFFIYATIVWKQSKLFEQMEGFEMLAKKC